jgi:hypothetical protein
VTEESWLADRVHEFASLRGRHVESWVGVERALQEDGPEFHHPDAPFLQLWGLLATLDGGEPFSIGTYEHYVHNPDCGLWRHQWPEFQLKLQNKTMWDGITRWRALSELPTGHVHEATVHTDEGVVAEVLLRIGGQPLLLMAGEAYETWEDGLAFHRLDESVLAFTDPAAADQIPWSTPRQGRVQASAPPCKR